MATIDRSSPISKQKIPAGTVVVAAGNETSSLTFIHSGLAELRTAGKGDGTRVGLIKGEALCEPPSVAGSHRAGHTVRARTECIVTNIPLGEKSLPQALASKPALAVQTLRSLVQGVESGGFLFRNYKYLWHKVASIADALALTFDFGPEILEPQAVPRNDSSLSAYSAYLRSLATTASAPLPQSWDPTTLKGDLQNRLELYADHDAVTIETSIDLAQFRFMKGLLSKPAQTLGPIFARDAAGIAYAYSQLHAWQSTLLAENERLAKEAHALIEQLFGAGGWIAGAKQTLTTDSTAQAFAAQLAGYSYRFHKDAINLLGTDLQKQYPLYHEMRAWAKRAPKPAGDAGNETLAAGPAADPAAPPAQAAANSSAGAHTGGLAKYQGLTKKIMDFAGWPSDEQDAFAALMTKFRGLDDKLGDKKEYVHLRAQIADHFWKLYEECYLKVLNTDLKSFVPGIMLHFGLLDETLVSQEELEAIDEAYAQNLYVDEPIPAMTLPYFLEKIFQGEVQPSMSEMGEEFSKVVKNQEKLSKKDKEGAYLYRDTPEDRVRYEIRQIAAHTSPLLFGSRRRYSAPLCSASMVGKFERLLFAPEDLSAQIDEYRSRDFSVFVRDLGLHHKFGTDIIQKEVVPNFVIYPGAGSRMMMWQELDGTSRHTAGRMFLPLLFNERKEEALLTLLAQYRWELQKTVAGASWMDPVEGGLVGSYYDYIAFYQKNHKLSSEAKERIKTLIKKTRSDRDRFGSDYIDWVLHEYEGKVRLNPVAREIFYRFCPFPGQMREEMAKKPLYADLEHKYQNRQRKSLLKIETRVKRFEKEGETVPDDLARHLEFLKA